MISELFPKEYKQLITGKSLKGLYRLPKEK